MSERLQTLDAPRDVMTLVYWYTYEYDCTREEILKQTESNTKDSRIMCICAAICSVLCVGLATATFHLTGDTDHLLGGVGASAFMVAVVSGAISVMNLWDYLHGLQKQRKARQTITERENAELFPHLNHPFGKKAQALVQAIPTYNSLVEDWNLYAEGQALEIGNRDPNHEATYRMLAKKGTELQESLRFLDHALKLEGRRKSNRQVDASVIDAGLQEACDATAHIRADLEVEPVELLKDARLGLQLEQLDEELNGLRSRVPVRQAAKP